ncbi:MAG: hypothetical protein A2Z06_02100 [Candidatus Glassbacteria bacterium RBG_16_58_8]|uniref:Polyprenyl synthetase n=1 Tax=Candidatus Glassbacteria bacterium RBG_16_58_8 TaxID=1817866 RepID=A0A1F5YC92_9BACT|nr:MAG: hypothetical protein A2Z06_02100 [Candidatus Glassbacteria bacterium RBG_16_58_8]
MQGAVATGAVMAGAGERELDAFREYGLHLGLAYQIADDLLDRRSDFRSMGKRTGRDEVLRKATFPSLYGEVVSERRLKEEIDLAADALGRVGEAAPGLSEVLAYTLNRGIRGGTLEGADN